jgi:hypothetical protein
MSDFSNLLDITAKVEAGNVDRDAVALHVGRIMQSCSLVENALFRMAAARTDVEGFSGIERPKTPALRNLITKVISALNSEIAAKTPKFKNPKSLKDKLVEFDGIASQRSELAHSEFLGVCEIEGIKVAMLSNEGTEGARWNGRKIQLWPFEELATVDKRTHQLANSLRSVIQNQVDVSS